MFTTFFYGIFEPRAKGEDSQRREFILNVLLVSLLTLVSIALLLHIATLFTPTTNSVEYKNDSLSLATVAGIECFLIILYGLSRWGFYRPVSYFLIAIFYAISIYMGFHWGVDAQVSLLFFVMLIVMSGVLIGTRFAFLSAIFSALIVFALGYMQVSGITHPNVYWKTTELHVSDAAMFSMIFLIIAAVSWLSNREIDKSLARARRSEAELKEERDMLEVRVTERTAELRKAEVEKMTQAYRFVEFGRLASGIFHDLMNPLTALSLNIDSIVHKGKSGGNVETLADDVERAKEATMHMKNLMDSMRKHLSREGMREHFSLNRSLEDIARMLASYARTRQIRIEFKASQEIGFYGDAVHFAQVMTNLLSNAIESYPPAAEKRDKRLVEVTLAQKGGEIEIVVHDYGNGISSENLQKIFEPFFTTKTRTQGLGIGLSLAKRIVEKEFNGTLTVSSEEGKGSSFVLHFPA